MSNPGQLSIYASPTEPSLLVPVVSPLEGVVHQVRVNTSNTFNSLNLHSQLVTNKLFNLERQSKQSIQSIINHDPNLVHGAP